MPKKSSSVRPEIPRRGMAPLYFRVYYLLRNEILGKVRAPGVPLPGEMDLARNYGVSRVTVRRALDRLAQEKLIVRRPGRHGGTFPVRDAKPPRAVASLTGLQYQIPWNVDATVQLVAQGTGKLPKDIVSESVLPRGELIKIGRLVILNDKPVGYVETYVPQRFRALVRAPSQQHERTLIILARSGLFPAVAEQELTVVDSSSHIAKLLNIPRGEPVVRVVMTISDQSGKFIEFVDSKFRRDTFVHRLTLVPNAGDEGTWHQV